MTEYKGTINYFQNLIIFESFIGVNRSFLIKEGTKKIICHTLFVFFFFTIFASLIYDIIFGNELWKSPFVKFYYIISILGIIMLMYVCGPWKKKMFEAQERLDLKCGLDDDYEKKIKRIARKTFGIAILQLFGNFVGAVILGLPPSLSVIVYYATAIHDLEINFMRSVLLGFNLRLMKLKDAPPAQGCRVYRHVLIAAAHLSEECNSEIVIMFIITISKIVLYGIYLTVDDAKYFLPIEMIIARQVSALIFLWMFCLAAYETEKICEALQFHLAARLLFNPRFSKEINPRNYKIARRFYKSVLRKHPQYMGGAVSSLGLHIPLYIVDVSVNYLLIFIQFYAAYKSG